MNWDNCQANESNIAETLFKEYKNIIRYNDTWEYFNELESSWIPDKDRIFIDKTFIIESYNKILERIIYWQNYKEITDEYKNHIILNFNKIIKVLSTKNKYKCVLKEAMGYFSIS